MPINFFDSIALDTQEIQDVALQNLVTGSEPAGVTGQIYFNTTDSEIRVYNGSAWVALSSGSSGVSSFTNVNGTFVSATTANTTATGAVSVGTIDLSATGTPSSGTFLRGDNQWAAVGGGTMSNWLAASDTGSTTTIEDGDTLTFTGGVGIDTVGTANVITLTLDLTELPANGDALVPASDKIAGVWNTGATQGTKVVDAIPISAWGDATSTIDMSANKILDVADPTLAQDAATKAYVDSATAGGLIFQGAYDASTTGPNSSAEKGWTYAVTVAGDGGGFWSTTLEIGDLIIAEIDSPVDEDDWTDVQNNIDLASNTVAGIASFPTANGFASMTGGAAILSAGSANASSIGSASETVTFTSDAYGKLLTSSEQAIAIPHSQVTDFDDEVNTLIDAYSHVASIGTTAANVITHSLDTKDVRVEVYRNSTPWDTVFAKVERNTVDQVTVTFSTAPGAASMRCLITKIA